MIHITTFGGIKPATSSWLLQPHMATVAHNTRLRGGTLEPFDAPVLQTTKAYDILGLHLPSDGNAGKAGLVTFPYPVSVTDGPGPGAGSHWDHFIAWPLDGVTLPFRQDRYNSGLTYPLVLLAPQRVPLVALTSTPADASVEPEERSYTYTWVDQFGVESPPAPPSLPVPAYDGQVYTIANFDTPPAHAVSVRVYRNSVRMELGDKDAPFDSTFQLVEEINLPASTYVDSRRLRELDFGTLQTIDNQPPRVFDMVVLTHEGYYVGFLGSELFVSERHEPHNWPEKYRVELPDEIVGICAHTHVAARYGHILTHDVVYALTTGRPYRVSVAWKEGPDHVSDANIQPVPFDEVYRCLDKHSIAKTNDGVMYVSDKGIVELKFQGPALLSTRHQFDEDYFLQYAPNMAIWHNGRYIAVSNPSGRAFALDNRSGPEGGKDIGDLVTIDLPAMVLHSGHDGRIYYVDYANKKKVYTFNEGSTPMTYRWRSKVFRAPGIICFGAAKIVADFGQPLTFSLYSGGALKYQRTINSSKPFRLPALTKQIDWQVQLEGSAVVREIHVAATIVDLADLRTGSQQGRKTENAGA